MNLQATVVERFRKFYKSFARTQSDALSDMMDYFEWHGFHPNQRKGKSMMNEILTNRKRTEANIAILRNIEKTQTKPVSIQMDLLFEGQTKKRESPKLVEKMFVNKTPKQKRFEQKYVSRVEYDGLKFDMDDLYSEFIYIIDRVQEVKPTFGQPYLKLDMSLGQFSTITAIVKRKKENWKKEK